MTRVRGLITGLFLLTAAAAAVVFVLHDVPVDVVSFAAWAGVATSSVGLLCIIRPLQSIGIRNRARAALVLGLGMAAVVAAMAWPASVARTSGPHKRLDDFLPEYQFREYHEGRVRAPVERVVDAVQKVSFADMPAAVVLMRLRGMASGHFEGRPPDTRPILDMMTQPGSGFLPLDVSNPREVVYGMVGRPWTSEQPPKVSTPEQFLAFDDDGQIRVAFDIRVSDEGGGVVCVSTETRTMGNDAGARRVFARYWRIIYPGSAIIRRVWLDAIIARAWRPAP